MNKVFLSGTLKQKPKVAYTPKGGKVIMFPLWVDDGAFSIDVVFVDSRGAADSAEIDAGRMIVSGVLTKGTNKTQDLFRLNANKIIRMEE